MLLRHESMLQHETKSDSMNFPNFNKFKSVIDVTACKCKTGNKYGNERIEIERYIGCKINWRMDRFGKMKPGFKLKADSVACIYFNSFACALSLSFSLKITRILKYDDDMFELFFV